ncbi:MAG: hypothetical protein AVDCRST_MAG49-3217 [uncultured Thermomicrobiales bacterium]|uniref:Uncharacterized protein n=1 Tax=uncultured Thermomicrobiales bacterium TaxID=1645740 RepID=A0A6J4V2Y7_9BACT|nr:MAG: hypothetical protein AVDCRST_MAG49-3217 [uncultured Thermomicrobiales bacterium]
MENAPVGREGTIMDDAPVLRIRTASRHDEGGRAAGDR